MTTRLFHLDDFGRRRSINVRIPGHSLFAIREDDEIYVYRNQCPHLGIELEWMENQFIDVNGLHIQCSTHGALFEIKNGFCVSGPCLGDSLEAIIVSIEPDGSVVTSQITPTEQGSAD